MESMSGTNKKFKTSKLKKLLRQLAVKRLQRLEFVNEWGQNP